MMESDYRNGKWDKPEALPFSGQFMEADPYYSPDYSTIYFVSKRPVDEKNSANENINIWRVSKSGNTWGEPEYVEGVNSDAWICIRL